MIYEKRLLVLSGTAASGCLRLEKTNTGVICYLTGSVKCDCVLVIKDDANFLCFGDFNLGSAYKFNLPYAINLDALVAAVGDTSGKLVMSGGFKRPMPWKSNLEDDVRHAIKCLGIKSRDNRDINDFFLDIIPTDYDDTRVAEVNYYRSNLTAQEDEASSVPSAAAADGVEPAPQQILPAKSVGPDPVVPETDEEQTKQMLIHNENSTETAAKSEEKTEEEPPVFTAENLSDEVASTLAEEIREEDVTPLPEETDYELRAKPVPELAPVSFYESVKDQIERLFSKNERYEKLEKLLPESRWIKVNYDSTGKYYLVGVIGDPVRYLCYGVPGEYSPNPPSDLVGYCQWLAIDENDPAGKGFWIMYQDGVTGKSVL